MNTEENLKKAEEYARKHDISADDLMKCEECGKPWPISLLDAKPWPGPLNVDLVEAYEAMHGTVVNFERLEGPCCYGKGYETP